MTIDAPGRQDETVGDESSPARDPMAPTAGPDEQPPVTHQVDRKAAFEAGTPKMSKKVIAIAIAVLLVLGVGGSIADHFVTGQAAPAAKVPVAKRGLPVADAPPEGAELHASLAALLGVQSLHDAHAAAFTLTDAASGTAVSLAGLRGHAVVLTFANSACNDICPVLAQEITKASAMVGTTKAPVTFLTVNTDPLAPKPAEATILRATSLGELGDYRFLTGSIRSLDAVWVSYGISITADKTTGVASHNDVMYFIKPNGDIAWTATPFADESRSGTYSLPAAEVTRFAQGIAHYADEVANAT